MKRTLIAIVLAGFGLQAGIAAADNNDVFAESYWKANLISVSGKASLQGTMTQAAQMKAGAFDFLTHYNP
jgi:hypothetical protein